MLDRTCVECDAALIKRPGRGRWPKYCSPHCRSAASRRSNRQAYAAQRTGQTPVLRLCVVCGTEFDRAKTRKKYCSPQCREAARGEQNRESSRASNQAETVRRRAARSIATRICYGNCTVCRSTFVKRWGSQRQVCSTRCRNKRNRSQRSEQSRAQQLLSKRNGKRYPTSAEARRRFDAKRSATKRGAGAMGERFSIEDVISRDGWTCGICSSPIDPTISWPHPEYRSLDHIIPVSVGGSHSLDNVQLAHFSCNSRKGNRAAA